MSTPQANVGTIPLVNGFLMWFQFSFQKKSLSSKMQEHFLATLPPISKTLHSWLPCFKYRIVQPLGLDRGMYFTSGII